MSMFQVHTKRWSLPHRVAFRFVFAYLLIFLLPFPLGYYSDTESLVKPYENLWDAVVPWVGKHVLRLSSDIVGKPNGSGDRTYDYVQLFCFLALAAAATLIWSLADARRTQYTKLHAGLRVYVRYALATILIGYGFAKVFKTQFPFPRSNVLLQTYGESSPMRLLWTFMGYSTGYNIFTGAAEALGGFLLLFRRTTTLGALVATLVMANVVMLNFCYDVPVKLFSSHLVLMALFLLLPDLRRLAHLFLLNRSTQLAATPAPFDAVWVQRARPVLKLIFVGYLLVTGVRQHLEFREQANAPRSPLAGGYEVEAFLKGAATLPPLTTDAIRWKTVSILVLPQRTVMTVRRMDGEQMGFWTDDDPAASTLTLTTATGEKTVMTYSRPDPDHLVLTGSYLNDTLTVHLRKIDESKLLLVSRGFHWINEFPFNR